MPGDRFEHTSPIILRSSNLEQTAVELLVLPIERGRLWQRFPLSNDFEP